MSRLQTAGVYLDVETHGDPQHPSVILMRGLGTQLIDWPDVMLEAIAAAGFHVVVFDNRDTGLSQHFDEAGLPDRAAICAGDTRTLAYTLRDMAQDVIHLMDALGIRKAHLLGISMGGMIAQVVAAHHGSRLLSMTSVMSSSSRPGLPGATPAAAASMRPAPPATGDGSAVIERIADDLVVCGSPGYPESLETRLTIARQRYQRSHSPDGDARQMAAIYHHGDRLAELAMISVPVLVIHGRDDPLIPLAAGEDTARSIPGSQFQVIDGMGHNIPAGLVPDLVQRCVTFWRVSV